MDKTITNIIAGDTYHSTLQNLNQIILQHNRNSSVHYYKFIFNSVFVYVRV